MFSLSFGYSHSHTPNHTHIQTCRQLSHMYTKTVTHADTQAGLYKPRRTYSRGHHHHLPLPTPYRPLCAPPPPNKQGGIIRSPPSIAELRQAQSPVSRPFGSEEGAGDMRPQDGTCSQQTRRMAKVPGWQGPLPAREPVPSSGTPEGGETEDEYLSSWWEMSTCRKG